MKQKATVKLPHPFRLRASPEQIEARVRELSAEISEDYKDKKVHLVGVLKGAVVFLSDLMRTLTVPATYDFLSVASYGDATESSGVVRLIKDLDDSVESRAVIIVEEIGDTGLTL